MPKLYEYFGLIIYFYANDHLPVHIHVDGATGSCKVEFIVKNGKVAETIIKKIGETPPLTAAEINKLKKILKHYSEDIIKKWEAYHVENRHIKPIIITKKLK